MKVLFVGNSHTYFNDMPQLFSEMCGAVTGEKTDVTMLAYSNRDLAWHCDEYFALRFALLYGHYDYCVIQQQGHPFPGEETTSRSAQTIMKLCDKAGTKPVITETWGCKGDTAYIVTVSSAYRKLASETGALLLPVGELFDRIEKEHPEIDLHWKDGAHASEYGTYLIAATLTGLLTATYDLSVLPDLGLDSRIDLAGNGGRPCACEDTEAIRVPLDPQKTAVIRMAVEEALRGIA